MASEPNDCDIVPKVANAGEVTYWNGAPVQIMHNGVRVYAGGYHGQNMIEIIRRMKGHHEPQEEYVFHEILKHVPDEGAMLEVGCFWAYYSLWSSHGKPGRRNFLIEPVQWKRLIGQINFILNEKEITIDPLYIADPAMSLEESTAAGPATLKGARPVSIDAYIQEKGIVHLDVLHADIQGAEKAMLEGAKQTLSQGLIDYIFISTHGDRHEECIRILQHHGYTLLATHTPQESRSADGLIVAAGPRASFKEMFSLGKT